MAATTESNRKPADLGVVFMGTPDFAVPSLDALVDAGYDVRAVVTQPDRKAGRGRTLKPPAVKVCADGHGLEVLQPEKLRTREAWRAIEAFEPDFVVVAAYGEILGPRYLGLASIAPINVHASLLPRYRGAAPIHWAIVRGDDESGVSIMRMAEGLDSGPVYAREAVPIEPHDTAGTLHDKLAALGARLLVDTLPGIAAGRIEPTAQNEDEVTWAPMLSKADGALAFDEPVEDVCNRARGMTPWPGAYCRFRGKLLKIHASHVVAPEPSPSDPDEPSPGQILGLVDNALHVACADGVLGITRLQVAGKKRQDAADFYHGYRPEPGECLTPDPRVEERSA